MKITLPSFVRGAFVGLFLATAVGVSQAQPLAVTAGEFTKVGLAGGQFLKIGVGARAAGMAGAFSGVANDVSSLYWNPAGIARIDGYAADVSHTFWFGGMSHTFAGAVLPVSENYRIGVSITSFGSGDIRITTMDQQDGTGGIYSVNDVALGFTFAGYLTDAFSFGVTGKYVQHAFSTLSATGWTFDIGTRYETGFNGVTLGFSIANLGTPQSYEGPALTYQFRPNSGLTDALPRDFQLNTSPMNMPLAFRAGVAADLFRGWISETPETDPVDGTVLHSWLVAVDFETNADVPEQFGIGTEYTFNEFVSVRAGYRTGHDQFGLSGGVGFRYSSGDFDGRLDYSISPTANIGLVNRLSLMMNFN